MAHQVAVLSPLPVESIEWIVPVLHDLAPGHMLQLGREPLHFDSLYSHLILRTNQLDGASNANGGVGELDVAICSRLRHIEARCAHQPHELSNLQTLFSFMQPIRVLHQACIYANVEARFDA